MVAGVIVYPTSQPALCGAVLGHTCFQRLTKDMSCSQPRITDYFCSYFHEASCTTLLRVTNS